MNRDLMAEIQSTRVVLPEARRARFDKALWALIDDHATDAERRIIRTRVYQESRPPSG